MLYTSKIKYPLKKVGIILVVFFFIVSCKKDSSDSLNIDARTWYEQNHSSVANFLKSKEGSPNEVKQEFIWKNSQAIVLDDHTELLSVPITAKFKNGKPLSGSFNLLIVKSNGNFVCRTVYNPDTENSNPSIAQVKEWYNLAFKSDKDLYVLTSTKDQKKRSNINNSKVMLLDTGGDTNGPCMIDWYMTLYALDNQGNPIYVISETYMYSTPCDVGGDNTAPPLPESESPCKAAKALAANQAFKDKFNLLKNAVYGSIEKGYTFNLSTNVYNEKLGTKDTVDPNVTSPVDGYIHNHRSGAAGHYATFDMYDVAYVYEIYEKGNMIDPKTFTAGIATEYGTYILKIDNLEQFKAFGASKLVGEAGVEAISDTFDFNIANEFQSLGNTRIDKATELALLTLLENSGLMLFKGNDNLTAWQAIKKIGDTIINTNCND